MGSNTLNNITAPKKIETDDVNQFYTALTGDAMPRNASSGAIEHDTHNIGSAAVSWKNLYTTNLVLNGALFDPDASGAGVDTSNAIVSGATRTDSNQPDFIRASGAGASMTILATATNLQITANATSVTITSDIAVSSLTVAPAANNTCAVNDASLAGGDSTKYTGEHESSPLIIDTVGTEISNRIGEYICLKGTAEYMFAYVEDATTLRNIRRGYFFDSSGAPIVREALTNNDTLTIMSLGWVFIDSDGVTVDITYTTPVYSATEPTSPVSDDYWFDLINRLWMRYDGAAYQEVDRIPCGLIVIDGTNAVASRTFDFTKSFLDFIDIEVELQSITEARTKSGKNILSVYSNTICYQSAPVVWDMAANLESGLTEANSTVYYLYITEDGDVKISIERPYDRLADLKGWYHPYHSWRYVGMIYNDSSGDISTVNSHNKKTNREEVFTSSGEFLALPNKGFKITVVAGGGGGGGIASNGGSGGTSSVGSIISAGGGGGGDVDGAVSSGGTGGIGSGSGAILIGGGDGGDGGYNSTSGVGISGEGGETILGGSTKGKRNSVGRAGNSYGGGGSGNGLATSGQYTAGGGGGGGSAIGSYHDLSGRHAVTRGAGASAVTSGGSGAGGVIIIEYL